MNATPTTSAVQGATLATLAEPDPELGHGRTRQSGQLVERETFSLSRECEYLSDSELTKQLGYPREFWPLAIVKELVDNSADNCEEHGILPEITVTITDTSIKVQDNGTGIPPETVAGMLDFSKRESSREAYRSLTRGAQGNAGKTIIGAPYVMADGEESEPVVIEAQGQRHEIRITVDQLEQRPKKDHRQTDSKVKIGTFSTVPIPEDACILDDYEISQFLLLAAGYAVLNPHLRLTMAIGDHCRHHAPSVEKCPKWTAADPDPPAWYDKAAFERLVAAMIGKDREHGTDRPIRDFVRNFAGLRGTAKLKTVGEATGLTRCGLSALLNCDGLDHEKMERLLRAMKEHGTEPKPAKLGTIGRTHVETAFENFGIFPATLQYKRITGHTEDGLPFVVEAAFAERDDSDEQQVIISGANFSPSIDRPIARMLEPLLEQQMITEYSPVVVLFHIATPAPNYVDRGKTAISLGRGVLYDAAHKCVKRVTADYCRQCKAEERDASREMRRREQRSKGTPKVTLKDAIVTILLEAVGDASAGGESEFNNRDLYYAGRPLVQRYTDKPLTQKYFDRVVDRWEIKNGLIAGRLRDPRDYLVEPHNGSKIPLGTKDVDDYTIPFHLYHTIVYFEKKGMEAKCAFGRIGDRYDAAIMASEGYDVRAAKSLLQAAQQGHKIKVLCFHDADPDGYNIYRTLSRATGANRYSIEVIDAGLHIEEALEMGLQTETFTRKKALPRKLDLSEVEREYFSGEAREVISKNGRSKTQWVNCRRVELNALSADPHRFVAWVESKLEQYGVAEKLIPPKSVCNQHARDHRDHRLRCDIEAAIDRAIGKSAMIESIRAKLAKRVRVTGMASALAQWAADTPAEHWTACVEAEVMKQVIELGGDIDSRVQRLLETAGGAR